MVQQDISTSEPQQDQLPAEPDGDFGIEDSTPQSVLDAENKFLNTGAVTEADEGAEPVAEDGAEPSEPTAVTESPEAPVTPEVAEPEPTPVAEPTPTPTSPPPGFIPIAEAQERERQIQSAKDREVNAAKIDSQVEAYRRDLSTWYAEQGIDPSQANQRMEQEIGQYRENLQSQSQLAEAQQAQAASQQQQVSGIMDQWALELKRQYNLSDADTAIVQQQSRVPITDEDTLRSIGENMGAMAARLGSVAKAESSAKKQAVVPAGSVQLENGASNAPPAGPTAALVRSANSKLMSQWTDAEYEAMRRQAFG